MKSNKLTTLHSFNSFIKLSNLSLLKLLVSIQSILATRKMHSIQNQRAGKLKDYIYAYKSFMVWSREEKEMHSWINLGLIDASVDPKIYTLLSNNNKKKNCSSYVVL